ncbi:hypothetical protein ACIGO8_33140 [Streptomyces sp. NPDC053493]|uniref:hypothetical protein n=1 Tax=Streptomyces sp. NPDC053493 TaxID=3365705 RepID=UPI0037D29899
MRKPAPHLVTTAKPSSAAGPVEPETPSTARVRDTIRLREGHSIPPEWIASPDGN